MGTGRDLQGQGGQGFQPNQHRLSTCSEPYHISPWWSAAYLYST